MRHSRAPSGALLGKCLLSFQFGAFEQRRQTTGAVMNLLPINVPVNRLKPLRFSTNSLIATFLHKSLIPPLVIFP